MNSDPTGGLAARAREGDIVRGVLMLTAGAGFVNLDQPAP
jgi:hypothetical protein